MATYPVNIPSLPPLASGINDNPAPPIAENDLLQDIHVAAATNQHSIRKKLYKFNPPLATQDEVVASQRRKYNVQSANFVGAPVPFWAHNLQEQMANMQQQTNQRMDRLQWQLQQESQKSINRSRTTPEERIEMLVRVEDGQMPNQQNPPIWFPNHHDAITVATGAQLNALLTFYGQPIHGTVAEKKFRLRRFLGAIL